MQHKLDAYKDGFQWVTFCKDCGEENPTGECSGVYVSPLAPQKTVNNVVSVDTKKEKV